MKLDCGPTVVAHLHEAAKDRVNVRAALDRAGQAVIAALPEKEKADMADDRQLREFTCDPKQRKVLVTDGKTALGQALAKCLRQGRSGNHLGRPQRALEEICRF